MAVTTITAAGAAPAPVRNRVLIQDVAECILSFPDEYTPFVFWQGRPVQLGDDIQNITMDDGRVYENIPVGDLQDIVGWTCLLNGWVPDGPSAKKAPARPVIGSVDTKWAGRLTKAEFKKLQAQHGSLAAMARHFGISQGTVQATKTKLGL